MMRTVVRAAALASALSLAQPQLAAAQDPDPTPPPAPAPRQVAVPRSERIAARDGEARTADAPDKTSRERERGAVHRAEGSSESAGGRVRREPPAAPEAKLDTPPTTSAAADDEQRSGRRGDVRRPPSDGSSRGDAPRGGTATVDRAVPRTSAPRTSNRVYVFPDYYRNSYYRYYDPWGFGAFGLGYFYYSPWAWGPGYSSYGYGGAPYGYYAGPRYGAYGFDVGSVKLKVKPRDAEVFVDGYYAGVVDDFDGVLQSLKLDSGAHTIEIRKPGLETLRFDVHVQPERSITFRGDMKAVP